MNDKKVTTRFALEHSIVDSIRQLWFPAEFRIAPPCFPQDGLESVKSESPDHPVVHTVEQGVGPGESVVSNQLVAEFATCLWYLKTKHFKRAWDDLHTGDDDPRVRRALGRLNKSIERLHDSGVEVQDPTNKRYPQGGEAMMRPIQFLPTAGLTFELVSETVAPIIYRGNKLIQRAEVFVGVPAEQAIVAAISPGSASPSEAVTSNASPHTAPRDAQSLAATSNDAAGAEVGRNVTRDTERGPDLAQAGATAGPDSAMNELRSAPTAELLNEPRQGGCGERSSETVN